MAFLRGSLRSHGSHCCGRAVAEYGDGNEAATHRERGPELCATHAGRHMLTPWGLLLVAIGAVAAVIYRFGDQLGVSFDQTVGRIAETIRSVMNSARSIVNQYAGEIISRLRSGNMRPQRRWHGKPLYLQCVQRSRSWWHVCSQGLQR